MAMPAENTAISQISAKDDVSLRLAGATQGPLASVALMTIFLQELYG